MPVSPAIASPDMTSFAMLRTCQLTPSVNACTVNAGCLIWTPTKMAPATAVLMPAARGRLAVVVVMARSYRSRRRAVRLLSRTVGIDVVRLHHNLM
jgi:hypothetical protein